MALNPEYLPKKEQTNVGMAGKDVLLYVAYGSGASTSGPFVLVGGQRNTPLEQERAEIDITDKCSGGNSETILGVKTWGMEQECVYKGNNEGLAILEYAFDNELPVYLMRRDKLGHAVKGWAVITKYSDDTPYDDAVSATISIKGCGPLEKVESEPDPSAAA